MRTVTILTTAVEEYATEKYGTERAESRWA